MQNNKYISLKLKLIIPLFLFTFSVLAQIPNSLYFMKGVPQIYQINPAFQPESNFFIGIPGISPLQIKLQNSPFALKDVVYYNEEIDSLITFLHPLGDKQKFLGLLNETNFISTEVAMGLISFGFRAKDLYFTFDVNERIFAQLSYPDDYIRLPIIGPDSGRQYDFNSFGMDFKALIELAMGVSKKFGDKLTVGIRGKILLGQANLNTQKFDVAFATGETSWPLHTDISLNTSAPYLADYMKTLALAPLDIVIGGLDSMEINTPTVKEITNMALNPKNFGLGFDIGADYIVNDWLQVSASIIDIGRIGWKSGVVNLSNNADYTFEGLNYSYDEEEDFFQEFADSLENTFNQFNSTKTKYSTWLPAKVYAGASFYVHPKISFGILSRTDFFNGNVKQQFTVSANLYPIRMLSTTFSYSIIDGYYKNLGMGLALKLLPLSIYVITDTGASTAMLWNETRYFNLRFGMNFMFGYKKAKDKVTKCDMPMVD